MQVRVKITSIDWPSVVLEPITGPILENALLERVTVTHKVALEKAEHVTLGEEYTLEIKKA
jgi:hypothetical protein